MQVKFIIIVDITQMTKFQLYWSIIIDIFSPLLKLLIYFVTWYAAGIAVKFYNLSYLGQQMFS